MKRSPYFIANPRKTLGSFVDSRPGGATHYEGNSARKPAASGGVSSSQLHLLAPMTLLDRVDQASLSFDNEDSNRKIDDRP